MPDSEVLQTLALVRTAKQSCSTAQLSNQIPDDQKVQLVKMYWDLDDLEGNLILQDLTAVVDKLTQDANDLTTVTGQLQTSIAQIQAVAQDVDTAAKAVQALVDVIKAAAAIPVLG